jgi:uncharacterized membrane protein YdcZ (DUF606 family)
MKVTFSERLNLASKLKSVLILTILLCCTADEARAYIDPGTGAFAWRTLIGGFVGVMFYFHRFIFRITNRRGRKLPPGENLGEPQ